MTRFAENTSVSVEKSRAEIERILQRYGCEDFAYRTTRSFAQIGFKMRDRMIRFDLPLPAPEQFQHGTGPRRRRRNEEQVYKAWEQACRQRWRALALVIKAKLEAVDAKISTFEIEFLAHTIMPGGTVFHELALPAIAEAYETGSLPHLLPPPGNP